MTCETSAFGSRSPAPTTTSRTGTPSASTGSFTYAYSRHNLFSGYTVHIQKANNVTTTHFRGRIDADGTEVDPSSFSGTLGAGDTDVQTALETIDDFVLGGSSTQSVVAFKCILDGCRSGVVRCRHAHSGVRGRATDKPRADSPSRTPAPPTLTDRVVIPENGIYELVVSVYANNPNASVRTTPHISFTVETGGTETVLDDEGTTYLRGATGSQQVGAIDHTALVELDVDDRIGVVMRQEGTTDITVVGVKSFFGILKTRWVRGGLKGRKGRRALAAPMKAYSTRCRSATPPVTWCSAISARAPVPFPSITSTRRRTRGPTRSRP